MLLLFEENIDDEWLTGGAADRKEVAFIRCSGATVDADGRERADDDRFVCITVELDGT